MHVMMRIAVEKTSRRLFLLWNLCCLEKPSWEKIMCFSGVVFVRSRCLNKYLQLEPVGSIREFIQTLFIWLTKVWGNQQFKYLNLIFIRPHIFTWHDRRTKGLGTSWSTKVEFIFWTTLAHNTNYKTNYK